jgi:DNA-binding response OmpR family regulator
VGDCVQRLLVVEDEVLVGMYLQEELQDAGFQVLLCTDAESALESLSSERIDGAVVDVELPGLSGVALLKRCRDGGLQFPVILASGANTFELANAHRNDEGVCVLAKPYDGPALLACLQQVGIL